ncbi:MAG: DNA primase [Alphaproteobacteria bacterium]|nr:DNA primase [Alphaproteobacteria bacterium]
MAFPRWFIDDVLARTSIVEVVGRRVAYDRRKSNPSRRDFWGCCPFHDEKTPSFHVEEAKGFYHCFGCGKSGTAITFLEETEGLPRDEAVKRLAAEAGLALPTASESRAAVARAAEGERLSAALAKAQALFLAELQGGSGREARAYLARRGIDEETARTFGIGLAPAGWDTTSTRLAAAGIAPEALVAAGLARPRRTGGGLVDVFRHRVTIPICDLHGRVIAFGARALDPAEKAKYLNSPETALFHKGEVLFNLHRAGPVARRSGRLVVVEGYMDAIALAQGGVAEAVAPLGTALTLAQARRLFQIAPEVVLMFDGDEAGREATRRALGVILPDLRAEWTVRVARLPDGRDPDDLLREAGAEGLKRVLAEAEPLAEALWSAAGAGAELDDPQGRQRFEQSLFATADLIRDPALRRQFRDAFRERLQAQRAERRLAARGRAAPRPPPLSPAVKASPLALLARAARREIGTNTQRSLVLFLMHHPWLAERHAEALSVVILPDPQLEELKQRIVNLAAVQQSLDSQELKGHLLAQGAGDILKGLFASLEARRSIAVRPGATEDEIAASFRDLLRRPELAGNAGEPGHIGRGIEPSKSSEAGRAAHRMASGVARIRAAQLFRRER